MKHLKYLLLFLFVIGVSLTAFFSHHQHHTDQLAATTVAVPSPSGQQMPLGDIPGWHQIFTDDFTTDVSLGNFPNAVSGTWNAYPDGWMDTSKNGTYYPSKVVSIQNGVMNLNLHTENGIHMVSAPEPKLPGAIGSEGGLLYGRYMIRFKADPVPGYKTAWLLWPDSEVWPGDGEIDFPEGDLTGTICAYMHYQNGTSGNDQDQYCTQSTYASWHTAIIEWLPTRLTFILDGQTIGTSTTRIPNTPMHWVIQTETALNGTPPSDTAAGNVQIDWVAVYAPTNTSPTQTITVSPSMTPPVSPSVVYRGLNLFGPWQAPWGGTNVFANTTQLDYYKAKGLTTIRQPILWEALQPTKFGLLDPTYLGMMDTFIANLKARNMRASFTFINQGVYPARSTNVISGTDLADVWTKLALHYKNESTVWAYDLMNEPYNDTNWLSHAQQVINAIRTVDQNKPIIAMPQQENSSGYSGFTGYTDSSNTLWYEAHTYFDAGSNGFYNGTYDQEGAYPMVGVDRAKPFVQWCQQHATINGQVRCIEGEYGIPGGWTSGDPNTTYGSATTDPRWLTVLDNFLTYLDQNGMGGTYWSAGPYGGDTNSVEPNNVGQDRPQMAILTKHLGFMHSSLMMTPTPTLLQGSTIFSLTLCPHGLGNCGDNAKPGSGGNTSPQHTTRTITLTLLNQNNQPIAVGQGSITYNTSTQNFQGSVSVPSLPAGSYLGTVKMDGYLTKQLPGIITVTQGQTVMLPTVSLVTGDINNDDQVDILDYNVLISCFGSKQTSATCTNSPTTTSPGADITDDGIIDGADYNLFLRELSVQKGGF